MCLTSQMMWARAHANIMVYTSALLGVVAVSYRGLAMARRGVEATGRPFKSEPFIANCWLQGLSGAVLEVEAGRNDATSVRTFSLPPYLWIIVLVVK